MTLNINWTGDVPRDEASETIANIDEEISLNWPHFRPNEPVPRLEILTGPAKSGKPEEVGIYYVTYDASEKKELEKLFASGQLYRS